MNHDATHCYNYNDKCPKTCYRAQLTKELKEIDYPWPVSWALFKGTDYCPKWPDEHKEVSNGNYRN